MHDNLVKDMQPLKCSEYEFDFFTFSILCNSVFIIIYINFTTYIEEQIIYKSMSNNNNSQDIVEDKK